MTSAITSPFRIDTDIRRQSRSGIIEREVRYDLHGEIA